MTLSVIGVRVDPVSSGTAIRNVVNWARSNDSRYICVANTHMLMEARDSTDFAEVLNRADMVTADGMPLVWMLRMKGDRDQERVYGPTLMLHILAAAAREKLPVGFYGSRPEVLTALLKRLQARFPSLDAAFSYSPPFREISAEEDLAIVQQINRSGTRVLFVGLGCPKQEVWMAEHRGKVNAVMIGVGAAFDFHAGLKPQAPPWLQGLGLEWLFRLLIEPRRLWKRYLYHNPRFVFLAMADLLGLLKKTD